MFGNFSNQYVTQDNRRKWPSLGCQCLTLHEMCILTTYFLYTGSISECSNWHRARATGGWSNTQCSGNRFISCLAWFQSPTFSSASQRPNFWFTAYCIKKKITYNYMSLEFSKKFSQYFLGTSNLGITHPDISQTSGDVDYWINVITNSKRKEKKKTKNKQTTKPDALHSIPTHDSNIHLA